MTTKEKALAGAGTPTKATETAAFGGAAISCYHSNTVLETRQLKISGLLSRGAENAIPLRDLQAVTGLDGRVIRRMVEEERRAGVELLANTHGFYMADSPTEVAAFVKQMRGRAHEILKTAAAVEGATFFD